MTMENNKITSKMIEQGIPIDFVDKVSILAISSEGVGNLMELWNTDGGDEYIVDLQEILFYEDKTEKFPQFNFYTNFDKYIKMVKEFKINTKRAVEEYGGFDKLSEELGVPIQYIDNFFDRENVKMPQHAFVRQLENKTKVYLYDTFMKELMRKGKK